ncbi:hypothetical protein BT96DRAFT_1006197 [Gymnopus androsaceus JB14]|uniref:Uncharacterized protein n=1 Tax=Gymnopus androsaceus JB14 TaxID=1447944 RepID=A0A6A4GM06_9AGAR|nr:hypothetical protein BT96DRAFT_1006197 [Gymnopus androsaceus JB14]
MKWKCLLPSPPLQYLQPAHSVPFDDGDDAMDGWAIDIETQGRGAEYGWDDELEIKIMGKVNAAKLREKQKKNAEAARKCRRNHFISLRNVEEYNRKARDELHYPIPRRNSQSWPNKNILDNRDSILDKAAEEHYAKFIEKHGTGGDYATHDVQPRYLLGVRDPSTPLSERIYQQKLRIWKPEKKEKQSEKADEMVQRRMEQAWDALEEEQLLAFARDVEAGQFSK